VNAPAVLSAVAQQVAEDLSQRDYHRLLQWPRGRHMPEGMRACEQGARRWYARHGKPFIAARRVAVRDIEAGTVTLESGAVLSGARLATSLHDGDAYALAVVVASAGPEVAAEAARRWDAGHPDEAYFLDRLAAGVAEGLLARAASDLCRELAPRREHLLPHHSPGCGDWGLDDQPRLVEVLGEGCGPVMLLASGALTPQHSVLAAFGITRRTVAAASPVAACRRCDLDPCVFRRIPFQPCEPRQ
jgi:hypothetical protein